MTGHSQADETLVPRDADPSVCAYCGEPFTTDDYLALHWGLEHGTSLSADERAAHESAVEAERAALRRFRILALGALVALYFALLFAFAIFA